MKMTNELVIGLVKWIPIVWIILAGIGEAMDPDNDNEDLAMLKTLFHDLKERILSKKSAS